jgi:prepilin-type N-terminal cleavage/methylation domain-containing protein
MTGRGFTLAEVLITLGIIGVVAALTIPGLVANYQKKVLETRIKKFYSTIQQAGRMKEAEDGAMDYSMLTAAHNGDMLEKHFKVNYEPYFKVIGSKKTSTGFVVGLPDGSGIYFIKICVMENPRNCFYMLFCVDYSKCAADVSDMDIFSKIDGKSILLFDGTGDTLKAFWEDKTREWLIAKCQPGDMMYCATLLEYDGWEVKDDYPVKF